MSGATVQAAGTFDAIVAPSIDPWRLLGLESYLLQAVADGSCAPVLLVYTMPHRSVALGRYHFFSGADQSPRVTGWRRMTGGRVGGSGEGWVGLALILPSRTALLPERDRVLKPEQVMNRYVRGLLGGLRAIGIEAFYPGRDAVTVHGREIAMCALECNERGATLFEALVAKNYGMEELLRDLEDFDPDGQLTCAIYGPHNATKIVRELDRDVSFDEAATAIVDGYARLLGGANRRPLRPEEIAQADRRGAATRNNEWFRSESPAPDALSSRIQAQLGAVETRIEKADDGSIARFGLYGDFIANSSAIRALQSEMAGKPLQFATVSSAVMKIFAQGDNFILGLGDLSNLVNLVMCAR